MATGQSTSSGMFTVGSHDNLLAHASSSSRRGSAPGVTVTQASLDSYYGGPGDGEDVVRLDVPQQSPRAASPVQQQHARFESRESRGSGNTEETLSIDDDDDEKEGFGTGKAKKV